MFYNGSIDITCWHSFYKYIALIVSSWIAFLQSAQHSIILMAAMKAHYVVLMSYMASFL